MQRRAIALTLLLAACGSDAADPIDPIDPPVEDPESKFPVGDLPTHPVEPFKAPTATIVFPSAASTTDASSIVVRGTASDGDGILEVRVNDTLATTTDDFATWTAEIALVPGQNAITVSTTDDTGLRDDAAARADVIVRDVVGATFGLMLDGGQILAVELEQNALVATDRATGRRTIVPDVVLPFATTIALDSARREVLLASSSTLVGVDLTTKTTRTISSSERGTGTTTIVPLEIAVDEPTGIIYVVDILDRVLAIDPATGNRTLLSGLGSGPELEQPSGLVVDAERGRLLVLSGFPRTLLAIDPNTGDRTVVSSGEDTFDFSFRHAALDAANDRLLTTDTSTVMAIDLTTGQRSTLGLASGADQIAIATDGQIVVSARGRQGRFDVTAETVALFVDPDFGSGIPLATGNSIVASPDGALLADGSNLIAVDLATRARTVVDGPSSPQVIVPLAANRVLLLESFELRDFDVATRRSRLISDDLDLFQGQSVALDAAGGIAYVQATFDPRILGFDLETGEKSVLLELDTGGGAASRRLIVDPDRNALLFTDGRTRALHSVDLATKQRTTIADESTGCSLANPLAVATISGQRALVGDGGALLEIDRATGACGAFEEVGPSFENIQAIATTTNDRAFVMDSTGLHLVDLQTGHHVIVAGH